MASLFILLSSLHATATMAPRMYSIMAQFSGSISESTDAGDNALFNHKMSFEALYLVRGGPTFGGRYIIEARNDNESTSGQAYGPMAGFYSERGYFVLVTYDVLAKLGRWTNGEGFEVDLGYMEHIGDQIHVGVKYSYRKMRYKTDIADSTAVQKDVAEYFPSLVLNYLF
ncbi:MAG: hypothetical protein H7328_05340 [Bdellovibrio sp.]|nr:hypothetical protein [Bdellovibrio sp.]